MTLHTVKFYTLWYQVCNACVSIFDFFSRSCTEILSWKNFKDSKFIHHTKNRQYWSPYKQILHEYMSKNDPIYIGLFFDQAFVVNISEKLQNCGNSVFNNARQRTDKAWKGKIKFWSDDHQDAKYPKTFQTSLVSSKKV